ncbi:very-long-chain 3-oxoacyl-CoA reductase 1 isoform X2 [Morus notabilis]|uniref:very-long-chain 3-oxoacyl-CoA reductase 1 isoform X2 n=1 Tax=Morus notabilis TaxID=981085 RepID=UPI000CED4235|nr:very-long-chain 3-oxoacyl-CoA reductase 1 isoform X2 [Morus notabilis]
MLPKITTSCFTIKLLISFVRWVWIMFLRPPKNLKEYGSWAMITGPTAGIGKAIAFELASKGLNLVLVGRNPSKLEATSAEIRRDQVVQVKTVVIDLAKSNAEEIARVIDDETRGLDVGVVINNAGLAYPYARFFDEVDSDLMESIMKVNMEAPTWITWSVLPRMLEKKKGAIVNIGSASSAVAPSYPLVTVYAASKAYLAMFSRSTSVEYKQSGIDIQCQIPLFVATKMTKLKAKSFFIPSPEAYSRASVRSIGYEIVCAPYWFHSVQWFISDLLPDALLNWCLFSYFLGMSKRAKLKESQKIKKFQQQ